MSASSSSFEPVVTINCLVPLDLGAGVEEILNCVIIMNRQAMQSIWRSMDWKLEGNMVDGLFFCATLTGRRGGHTPFVQRRMTGAFTWSSPWQDFLKGLLRSTLLLNRNKHNW